MSYFYSERSIKAGAIAFTRMPCAAYDVAALSVRATTARLLAW